MPGNRVEFKTSSSKTSDSLRTLQTITVLRCESGGVGNWAAKGPFEVSATVFLAPSQLRVQEQCEVRVFDVTYKHGKHERGINGLMFRKRRHEDSASFVNTTFRAGQDLSSQSFIIHFLCICRAQYISIYRRQTPTLDESEVCHPSC